MWHRGLARAVPLVRRLRAPSICKQAEALVGVLDGAVLPPAFQRSLLLPQALRSTSSLVGPEPDAGIENNDDQRRDILAVFTCSVCDTRSTKAFSSQAYNHGVVIVQCDGCKNRHLLADRLGWFGDPGSIEDFLGDKGEEVRRKWAGGETLQLTEDDLKGWTPKSADRKG
eukprot:jgi/Botrbrau1/4366/Bobra.105_2s0013.1